MALEQTDQGTKVSAADPHDIITNPALSEIADDAADKLRAALDSLGAIDAG